MSRISRQQPEYLIEARRIAGTRAEKLDQIDEAIGELLDLKRVECAEGDEHIRFLAHSERSHWLAMSITLLVLFVMLALLLGVSRAHAPSVDSVPATKPQPPSGLAVWWVGTNTGAW